MKYKILICSIVCLFSIQWATAQCEDYRDSFEDRGSGYTYGTNHGSLTWTNSWTEINDDGNVLSGDVMFDTTLAGASTSNHSVLIRNPNTGLSRSADLSNCTSTELYIRVRGNTNYDPGNLLYFAISADGVNFDTIGSHEADDGILSFYHILPPSYNTSNFTIQLLSAGSAPARHRLQDIKLDCCDCMHYSRPETSLGAGDGAIVLGMHAEPNTSALYSIDGGVTWQNTTSFDPLAAGTYSILIKQPNVAETYGPCNIEVGSVLAGDTRCPEPTTRGVQMTINNN